MLVRNLWIGLVFLAIPALSEAAEGLTLFPSTVELRGPEARHRLLLQRTDGSRILASFAGAVEWKSSDEKVARVENGTIVPVGNGQATITAVADGKASEATVRVRDMESQHQWSFRNDVLPVLAKTGCNSGACHGALAGKGGFKLSLRGYDPNHDFQVITRQARGRRIELSDPGASLLLTKPSGGVPHKGGVRFEANSPAYRILGEWISAGVPGPQDSDPRAVRLEIFPKNAILAQGDQQQLVVQAHFSDGRVEDVTRWVKYSSSNETVAQVDDQGVAKIIGHGEGAIVAWYSSQIVLARVTAPYPNQITDEVYALTEKRNFIDDLVLAKLRTLNLLPAAVCSDAEFIRRAYLDTIGTLPTAEEVRLFLADSAPDKRDKLIEALLARSEFVDYWTYKWSDMLLINGQRLRPAAVKAYYQWIHEQVKNGVPWDQFVRGIVTAQGSSTENGATNFYALHQDPEEMAENVSQAFMGLSINCAKCHNHPLEKWTNNQYYAFANLFARVRAKGWGGDFRSGDGVRTLYVLTKGDLIQPLTGRPQPPTPLDGESIPLEDTGDRRIHLANWLTSPQNPYFTRTIVNRVWASFLTVGIVDQVDDLRASNPASNEELLNALCQHLVENKYDLKSLMRVILQSKTYQRSSVAAPENKDERRFYSRYYPKRLMAEVLLDAVSQVTDVPTEFTEIGFPGNDKAKTDFYPKGTRAIQLYDSAVASYFLKAFGRNTREITCECERSEEASMVQVMHLSNGDTLNGKLKAADNRLDKLIKAGKTDVEMMDEIYLTALSRLPTPREKTEMLVILQENKDTDRRILWEDIFWCVLTTREFLFNH